MTRIIILSFLCCCSFLGVKAQDMASVFSNMPDQHILQLESAWRKDLIDLFKGGKDARLQNVMGGYSVLKGLTADYLLLQTSERSTVEMKLLPLVNNTHILCMITTVDGPVSDSVVEFFTTDWKPLAATDLFEAASPDWFQKEGVDKNSSAYKDAVSRLDVTLFKYELNPDKPTLTATYTTPLYLNGEDSEMVKPFLKDTPRVYTWRNSRFI